MSLWRRFKKISGMDSLIDRNEYEVYHHYKHPYLDPVSNRIQANHEFSMIDRNRDNRIDYYEFADAERRRYGYYPEYYPQRRNYGPYYY
ncbi:hypothetical protein BpHYR1_016273 [Brachionus plicatilis]|uniref:EF-hand domain-containing protein n=1 Tax=Brachionus plicatilis TaxID=10195 RepID=A0A3M7RKU6_BRAPC|nr:hypothetical protein BpHYR1_016273 [Brachionus plicatilis]